MLRNKILLKTFIRYKQKLGSINLQFGFRAASSHSVIQNNSFFNLEATDSWKAFLFNRTFSKIKSNEKYMSQLSQDTCWNCKQALVVKDFTCSLCGVLQPPKENINFFELLGVSHTFNVDLEDITRKFRKLQSIFHPDKVTNKSKEELEISETYSRLLNTAYTTLKDPISRGFYLLDFYKVLPKTSTSLDQKFLSEIMEKNEELETMDNLSSLKKFLEINNEEIEKQYFAVQMSFQNSNFQDANLNLLKLNYLFNLDRKIKDKEMTLTSSDTD